MPINSHLCSNDAPCFCVPPFDVLIFLHYWHWKKHFFKFIVFSEQFITLTASTPFSREV